jgi:hypothetical protein
MALLLASSAATAADLTLEQLEVMGLDAQPAPDTAPVGAPQGREALIAATLVLQEGDTPPGAAAPVSSVDYPTATGAGSSGFTGDQTSDDDFVFYDGAVIWRNSDAVGVTLTGAEATSGVGLASTFIYSPSIDGFDGVWTHAGELARDESQAPGLPAGTNSTFHSRPTMIPSGQAFWVAGYNETGGTTTEGRVMYTSTDATPATITVLLKSGDVVGGFPISSGSSGIMFDYDFSDDGIHYLQELDLDTGSTLTDGAVYLDGVIVAQEGSPNGTGDNWDNFDEYGVNNDGHFLFSGDTDGDTTTDEFIAYDGAIVIREGDTIAGVPLATSATVTGLAINNLGHAVHAWNTASGEFLFFACDAANLAVASEVVLAVGDDLDLDGNGTADALLVDINSPLHMFTLDDSGVFHFNVDIDYGAGAIGAVIAVELPSCQPLDDLKINEVDYQQPGADDAEFIEIYNPTAAPIDLSGYVLQIVDAPPGPWVVRELPLPAVDLAPGDYFVVCGDAANVFNCDLDVDPSVDLVFDGSPSAVAIAFAPVDGLQPTVVDTVSYGGDVPGYTEGSGLLAGDNDTDDFFGISRWPNGVDTDSNSVDFSGRCHTPGLENIEQSSNCNPVPVELMQFSIE